VQKNGVKTGPRESPSDANCGRKNVPVTKGGNGKRVTKEWGENLGHVGGNGYTEYQKFGKKGKKSKER